MTGPDVPPGGEELRAALMKWLSTRVGGMCWDEAPWQEWGDEADELLALPAVRDALAAQEKLRRVEELRAAADFLWDETGAGTYAHNYLQDKADDLTDREEDDQ